jgi:hypothetical protein
VDKRTQRRLRQRYIKELERFTNRIVSFCQKEITKEEFDAYIEKIFKPLEEVEKTYLGNEYLKSLERFVETTANLTLQDLEITAIKERTLHGANALRKLKRIKKYNRHA